MGKAKINVWFRDRKTCAVIQLSGKVSVTQCCGAVIASGEINKEGFCELIVPPGCYIVSAKVKGYDMVFETMVIVNCDKSACVNFLLPK